MDERNSMINMRFEREFSLLAPRILASKIIAGAAIAIAILAVTGRASGQYAPSPGGISLGGVAPGGISPGGVVPGPRNVAPKPPVGVRQPLPQQPRQGQTRQARADLTPRLNWEEFEPARIMGQVGEDVVLAGDILGLVDQQLAPYVDTAPPDQLAQQREVLIRSQLASTIQRKALYQWFIQTIPPDRRNEAVGKVWEQVAEKFNEEELPKAMKTAKVNSTQELEQKLQGYGWSVSKQIRAYGERQLGMYGVFQKIDRDPEVTHAEMIKNYKEHVEDYRVAAQVRFEKLTANFAEFDTEDLAYHAIVKMGDEIVLGGAPFWAVAKRSSHGINAEEGGVHDWTIKGSLASEAVDEAVFSNPIGRMSRIIRDDRGFHIIRVTERTDEGFTSFVDAQAEIKKKLQGDKREAAFQAYMEKVRDEIPVWTIFDEEEDAVSRAQVTGSTKSR